MERMAVVATILDPLVSASDNLKLHFASYYRLLAHEFGPERPQTPGEYYYDTYIRQSGVHHP